MNAPQELIMDFSDDKFNQAFRNLSEDVLQAFDLAQQNR